MVHDEPVGQIIEEVIARTGTSTLAMIKVKSIHRRDAIRVPDARGSRRGSAIRGPGARRGRPVRDDALRRVAEIVNS